MDRTALPPPPLGWDPAHAWLTALRPALAQGPLPDAQWKERLLAHAPSFAARRQATALLAWVDREGLREPQGEGWTWSLRGVAWLLSTPGPRREPTFAWATADRLVQRIDACNALPPEDVPLAVVDVLIFGSMTDPVARDHGDLDAVLLLQAKTPDAVARYDAAWRRSHPAGPPAPSCRRELPERLGLGDPFLALSTDTRTLAVLLDHNPGFSCFSLRARTWSEAQLAHTNADEDAAVVAQALANGRAQPERTAHVDRARSLARMARTPAAPLNPPPADTARQATRATRRSSRSAPPGLG